MGRDSAARALGAPVPPGTPRPTLPGSILLIEDDASLRESTALALEDEGFHVEAESDGAVALARATTGSFDLILLDLMLPSLDGLEICRRVRGRSTVPIIMLTARSDSTDIIVGLEVGADDYVTKPFDPRVLIARIRALLRRGNTTTVDKTKVDGLEIDRSSFRVTKDDVELQLTATEFHLLDYLARNRGRVATRQMLLAHVWGYDYLGDSRLVDTAIKRLRQKVEDDPRHPEMIKTVRSIGYRLET